MMNHEPELRLVESVPLRYLVSVPLVSEAPTPVLCFLHGYDEAAPTEIRQGLTRHGPLRPGNPPSVRSRFLLVAPQLPDSGGDVWEYYGQAVTQIVREVHAQYGGDPLRTYLTGFSFGGNGVFDLALQQPGLWAALWPVDPTRVPRQKPDEPMWLSSGEVSRRQANQFLKRLELQPPQDHSEHNRVYTDDGFDHVGTATAAYRNQAIYDWLLSKCRRRVDIG